VGDTPYRLGDPLLTPRQVAKELQHDPDSISRMCARGDFPGAFRTGKRRGVWRIPRSGLEAYVKTRQEETERAAPRAGQRKRRAKATG
jgi:predicted DNA-binding transcriptional regulator AlpA